MISCERKNENQPNAIRTERDDKSEKRLLLENIGKVYYERNCVDCHASKFANDNYLVNAVITDRYDFVFFRNFVQNQDSLINANDSTALQIRERYGNVGYSHKFRFTDQELKSLIFYLKN